MPATPPATAGLLVRLRPYLPLVAVAAAAFVLRLAVVGVVHPTCDQPSGSTEDGSCWILTGDTEYVVIQARELRNGHGFVEAGRLMFGDLGALEEPGAAHPPLYTLVLAGLQTAGVDGTTGWRVAMSLVGSVGVACVGLASWRLGGDRRRSTGRLSRKAGLAAAGLAAVNPLLWTRDTDMLVEALLIPLIPLAVVAALRVWRHPGWANAALLGGVVGVAWLARSEQIAVLVCMAPMFWWGMRELRPVKRIGLLALAGVVAGLLMAPWSLYNLSRFERPVPLSTNGALALLFGTCDDTYYKEAFAYYDWWCVRIVETDPTRDESIHEQERLEAALQYIRDHPRRTPLVMAARLGRYWRVYAPVDTTEREAINEGVGWVGAWANLGALYALAPFAVAGAVALRRRRIPLSPLLGSVLVGSVAATALIPLPRFRVPADVVVTILAVFGALWLWERRGGPTVDDQRQEPEDQVPASSSSSGSR